MYKIQCLVSLLAIHKDDVVPFPWSLQLPGQDGCPRREAMSTAEAANKTLHEVRADTLSLDPRIKSIRDKLFPAESFHLESSHRLLDTYMRCLETGCIGFSLPPLGALAGRVLRHAVSEIEKLFAKHEPLIWKVGYTHNALWRWSNKLYGYAKAVDKWERLEVLYIASEPFSPAMLEAALIEKFQSPLAAHLFLLNQVSYSFCCGNSAPQPLFLCSRNQTRQATRLSQCESWW